MVRAEVPYKVVGGTKFYDRREVKDVMAYLRVLVNPDDEVSWRRIVNVPKRGVGETSVAKLAGWSGTQGISFGEAVARAGEAGVVGQGRRGARGAVRPPRRSCAAGWSSPTWSTRTATRLPPEARTTTRHHRRAGTGPVRGVPGRDARPRGLWCPRWSSGPATAASCCPKGPSRRSGGSRTSTSWSGWPTSTEPWPSSSRRPRWWPTRTSSRGTGPRSR